MRENLLFLSGAAVQGESGLGWGADGALEILSIEPARKPELDWDVGETKPVVTWILEESGGRTRITFAHSGFATPGDGLRVGWLHYLLWLKSLVEIGAEPYPAVKELVPEAAALYAASIWGRQHELEGRRGGRGDHVGAARG